MYNIRVASRLAAVPSERGCEGGGVRGQINGLRCGGGNLKDCSQWTDTTVETSNPT
jgi:hypothetical protein